MSDNRVTREFRNTTPARDQRVLGLFIIWEKGRHQERRILADLRSRFELLDVCEMHWASSAKDNFARFYSDIAVRGVYHVLSKGAGRFLVVTLADMSPRFEYRRTSRGSRLVNARFFDAKLRYRSWEGSELAVHCSETWQELDRDLMLLLGISADRYLVETSAPWRGEVKYRRCDLAGADGWPTRQAFFHLLNHTVGYAALEFPRPWRSDDGPQVELLTDDCRALCRIANTRPARRAQVYGGAVAIEVGGERVKMSVRSAGDGCYDPGWCRRVLASRVFDERGFYRPSREEQFWMFVYHAVVRRSCYGRDCARYLAHYAASLGFCGDFTDPLAAGMLLHRYMLRRGYEYTRPLNPTERFNGGASARGGTASDSASRCWRQYMVALVFRLAPAIDGYWRTRDEVLLRAPWVRFVKRLPRRAAGMLGGSVRPGGKQVGGSNHGPE